MSLSIIFYIIRNVLDVRLSEDHQKEFQHFLHQLRLLKFVLINELFADGVLDFFEYLGAQDQLKGGVDDGVDIICVLLSTAMVQKHVDYFEAEELEIVKASGTELFLILFSDEPVDE